VLRLEKAGHAIDVLEDGAAAIEVVRAGQHDLLARDVQMPGVDGLEAPPIDRAGC
jgi:CheY-like chemotaxis protein